VELSKPRAIRSEEIQWAAKNKKLLKRSGFFNLLYKKNSGNYHLST
jgi:hypothetical protein